MNDNAQVLAFGVMILRAGLFHSDPHPGNLLAACLKNTSDSDEVDASDIAIALLDFGQVWGGMGDRIGP